MNNVLRLYKPVGLTPLELLDRLRNDRPELKGKKLAYAGRLDPMAEGEMIILIGEECKNRKSYERLSKEYEFEILLGVSTDTYDVLGKIAETKTSFHSNEIIKNVNKLLANYIGKRSQFYPPYSSARVNGKPLFYWAREGKLDQINVPEKEIEIYSLKILSEMTLRPNDLKEYIINKINSVHGEFRQKEILEKWQEFFDINLFDEFFTIKLSVSCSSGTYVRSLVNEIGKDIGIPTMTLSINRTKINIEE